MASGSLPRHPRIVRLLASALLAAASPIALGQETKAIGVVDVVAQLDPALRPPDRFALVIGVAAYADERIPDLPACEGDARGLAAVLSDPTMGLFPADHVTVLTDSAVTRTAVVAALDELARKAGPDDLVVVYFSGHGATDEKGRAYWVMSDSKPDRLRATALPELEISELLGEIRTRRLVTVIDACYAAATASVGATKSLVDLGRIYPDFKGDGRVGMTASKGDQLSMVINDRNDPGFGHSAFSFHVIEGLRGPADARGNGDGVIELDELWSYVKDRTIETSRRQGGNQEPQLKGQVGSRFLLAVDGTRLVALAQSRQGAMQRSDGQIKALGELVLAERLSALRYEDARRLLRSPLDALSDADRDRRALYADLAEGRVAPAQLEALVAESAPAPVPGGWGEAVRAIVPRFTDIDAPLALAVDLDALREDPALARFAAAAGGWGVPGWSEANGGSPRHVVLLADAPSTAGEETLLLRAALRQHRSDGPLDRLLADPTGVTEGRLERDGAVTQAVGPRVTLTATGDGAGLATLLARPADARPAWTAALDESLRSALPLAFAADGPWCLERLERFAGGRDGRIFVGPIYAELMLEDADEIPRLWAEATDGLEAVSGTGQPSGDWIRTAIRLNFATAASAERAAPRWRFFLSRVPQWTAPSDVRPLDVQRSDRTLILRLDLRIAAFVAWLDRRPGMPGSAATR